MAWVLFFDGECKFCSKSVQRVHRLDSEGNIHFAPLQGELSAEKGFTKFSEKGAGTMVMLREGDGQVFLRSDAVAELGQALGGVWAVLGKVLLCFPESLRDWGYNSVARNRHVLAGVSSACEVPDEELKKRMRD